ncbi:HTH-type transcriptional regulator LrpA [Mesobacillus selenatarsenatis SF-1]|uniref:HTH-type transcriptional regulator LrpA n=2 Tax=Mesobacillus selenatarsenatis TaxID=388741 RepID=A0A0A8WXP1_MESS1|nr:HTH-type transcriptional regulator LrpA [Mesobacillus selenatarsenatis SF-1]
MKGFDKMLDSTDLQIIDELTKNSRITMKELGEKVHLTGQAASTRVAKLEDQGIIEGYTINVNQMKMGYGVHAIIHIFTKTTNHQPYLSFLKKQKDIVRNNFKVSGESCYLLECRFPSNESLDEFLTNLSNYVSYKLSIIINKY